MSTKADELPHLAKEEREEIRNNKGKVLTQWEELHNLLEGENFVTNYPRIQSENELLLFMMCPIVDCLCNVSPIVL